MLITSPSGDGTPIFRESGQSSTEPISELVCVPPASGLDESSSLIDRYQEMRPLHLLGSRLLPTAAITSISIATCRGSLETSTVDRAGGVSRKNLSYTA